MNEKNIEQQLDEISKIIDELIELNKTIPVIVEGNKDIRSLRSLGINGELIKVNTGKSILDTCEQLMGRTKHAIVLTDWDKKGGTIARQLKDALESSGIQVNLDIRMKLAILCKKDIKDIESLSRYISGLGLKINNDDIMKKSISKSGG